MQIDFAHLDKEQGRILNEIIGSAFAAVDPYQSVSKSIEIDGDWLTICGNQYNLNKIDRIFLTGMGKAVGSMAAAVVDKLGKKIFSGVVISKHPIENYIFPESIKINIGSHPVPSKQSEESADQLVSLVNTTGKDDLIINLISGGGSSLVTQPIFPITIDGGVVKDIQGNEIDPVINDFQNVTVQFTPEPGVNTIGITIDGSMQIDIEILPGLAANGVN